MPIRAQLVEIKPVSGDDDRLLCDLRVDDIAGRVVEMSLGGGTQHFARLDANGVRTLIDHLEEWLQPIEHEATRLVLAGDSEGASRMLSGKRQ